MRRRSFLNWLGAAPLLTACHPAFDGIDDVFAKFGNMTLLHITDCHAQLLPIHYREPALKIGLSRDRMTPGYLTGSALLNHYGIKAGSRDAYALTHLDFVQAAERFGKMGGFAHLATLINKIRSIRDPGQCLLLDGGDSWQGSATSLWSHGRDLVEACNRLDVNAMTGHWEFTHGASRVADNIRAFQGEFIAHNIRWSEEALFDKDVDSDRVFKPYVVKTWKQARVAIIGQAFPYTPIAHPHREFPDWHFGIDERPLITLVDRIRKTGEADAVVLLSHNGLDVDLKLASRVAGIDAILGGHSHDALPQPVQVSNPSGKTWVTNAGSYGKFLAVVDLDVGRGRLQGLRYRLLPIFADLIEPDTAMTELIAKLRAPHLAKLETPLATADRLLYRRDTFCGSFDRLILDALRTVNEADIALSPGFRWGTTLLPGQTITVEDVMNQTAITYPETYVRELTGTELHALLEDVADNLFNPDPYYRQGGDMVRTGGLNFACHPNNAFGRRIDNLRLDSGDLVDPDKRYKVSGWAAVGEKASGKPVFDVVQEYLNSNLVAFSSDSLAINHR